MQWWSWDNVQWTLLEMTFNEFCLRWHPLGSTWDDIPRTSLQMTNNGLCFCKSGGPYFCMSQGSCEPTSAYHCCIFSRGFVQTLLFSLLKSVWRYGKLFWNQRKVIRNLFGIQPSQCGFKMIQAFQKELITWSHGLCSKNMIYVCLFNVDFTCKSYMHFIRVLCVCLIF